VAPSREGRDRNDGCPFCPGHEHETPPEASRRGSHSGWSVRVFENRYPLAGPPDDADFETGTDPAGDAGGQFSQGDPGAIASQEAPFYGQHEVVVETPRHNQDLSDLTTAEIMIVLDTYAERIAFMERDVRVRWVQVFKNRGVAAGATLEHSHSQVVAMYILPPRVREKLEASQGGGCPYCSIIAAEATGPRAVAENDGILTLVPYAPRWDGEAWIMPLRHIGRLEDFDASERLGLALSLRSVLKSALDRAGAYDFMLFCSHRSSNDLHLHIEVVPRPSRGVKAGLELATGLSVVTHTPEDAARYYRERLLSVIPGNSSSSST
jgi:UDPglucose--hexose-1-phosphate uridylyltransferase